MPHEEVTFTLECSGDNGLPFFQSGVGNARWGGTSLARVLEAAQIKDDALEVVFYGADQGEEVVRQATPLEYKFTADFARSMPVADAISPVNMLCYEMNGKSLSADHGFPCRLIAPGWFGIANVKWLTRIEVVNRRFLNRFMGRDYVTIREEQRDGKTIYMETSVGRQLIKSAPASVIERDGRYQIQGMAWGPKPIATVEVKVDHGSWTKANLRRASRRLSGRPGGWIGRRHRATIRSPRGRSTPRVQFNQRSMIQSLPTRRPTGRATDRLHAMSGSRKSRHRDANVHIRGVVLRRSCVHLGDERT